MLNIVKIKNIMKVCLYLKSFHKLLFLELKSVKYIGD